MTNTETATATATAPSIDPNAVHADAIDGYFDCWNLTDAGARRAAVERVYTADAHLLDPLVDVTGHDALCELFAGFHVTYAGHSFRRVGGIDAHHALARWGWEMVDADGNVVLDGLDVALFADDGRMTYVAGFFGAALPG